MMVGRREVWTWWCVCCGLRYRVSGDSDKCMSFSSIGNTNIYVQAHNEMSTMIPVP